MGTDANDIIFALKGDDAIEGGMGDDLIFGGRGDDTIDGGEGRDLIFGGFGADIIVGGEGNDLIFAGRDDDVVSYIFADNQDNWGGLGYDLYHGGSGQDTLKIIITDIELADLGITRTEIEDFFDNAHSNRVDFRPLGIDLVAIQFEDILVIPGETVLGGSGNEILKGTSG